MNERQSEEGLVFTIVEDDGESVTIEVSEEGYQRELSAGVENKSLLKPGRYKLKRGGLIERHPKLRPREQKRA